MFILKFIKSSFESKKFPQCITNRNLWLLLLMLMLQTWSWPSPICRVYLHMWKHNIILEIKFRWERTPTPQLPWCISSLKKKRSRIKMRERGTKCWNKTRIGRKQKEENLFNISSIHFDSRSLQFFATFRGV